MVSGLEVFVSRFRGMEECFILIGGTACDIWMRSRGLEFRRTRDLDIVLVVDALRPEFFKRFWSFVHEGEYASLQQSGKKPKFYRFKEPQQDGFPYMIELLTRDRLNLPENAHLTPIPASEDASSLSAILLDDDYYGFVLDSRVTIEHVPTVPASCLIVLKARAWLDLTARRKAGDTRVKGDDIKKHRNDVFRLYRTLAPDDRFSLPSLLNHDLARFLEMFPEDSETWAAIHSAVNDPDLPDPSDILQQMRENFEIPESGG